MIQNHEYLLKRFNILFDGSGADPSLFFAPGRVNLIGEHTDYNDGYVLPGAINSGTYLMIRPNDKDSIRFFSDNFSQHAETELKNIHIKNKVDWINYPQGVVHEFHKRGIEITGYDMFYSGDIPLGAGLSSSASIEMVTAFALNEFLDATLEMDDLIMISKDAENQFVGVNCGIMDQFAAGLSEKDSALFLNCETLDYEIIPANLDDTVIIISNTNKDRSLIHSKYNERVLECNLALKDLQRCADYINLSRLTPEKFERYRSCFSSSVIEKRVKHVVYENQRVLMAVAAMKESDVVKLGKLMSDSHRSLRDNYEVTGIELDALFDAALNIPGVLGSRMTGAGFGGCTISLADRNQTDEFIQKVTEQYYKTTGLKPSFYITDLHKGVHRIF